MNAPTDPETTPNSKDYNSLTFSRLFPSGWDLSELPDTNGKNGHSSATPPATEPSQEDCPPSSAPDYQPMPDSHYAFQASREYPRG
ncbi:MAG: hypothetical protein EHM70_20430 [Chloroflexota bacterium]|nr:MAG: hypothetical protein EHM70_20430 [Chloroflexota bacterium]